MNVAIEADFFEYSNTFLKAFFGKAMSKVSPEKCV
ncbi:hypothetical protein D104_12150 [Marinomonas profundimaris]|uniref:Uncharacterized protein n=1 Tax=Marinomonas profundimaris TaxID=1208321 RepID=W1RX75_9GAMM|nr:hypothetical protein D104_12150 [Marinomonas profundimaris]